jgi:hypothetical protein
MHVALLTTDSRDRKIHVYELKRCVVKGKHIRIIPGKKARVVQRRNRDTNPVRVSAETEGERVVRHGGKAVGSHALDHIEVQVPDGIYQDFSMARHGYGPTAQGVSGNRKQEKEKQAGCDVYRNSLPTM